MFALLLCGLIAGVCAAPQSGSSAPSVPREFVANIDLRALQNEKTGVLGDLNRELTKLTDYISRTKPTEIQNGVVGNEYQILMTLPEFEEKDIVVRTRKGFVQIVANHKLGEKIERSYEDVKQIPLNVVLPGDWTFENEVLKITFPLKEETANLVPAQTA